MVTLSLRQVADRLQTIAQVLELTCHVPADLVGEISQASARCLDAHAQFQNLLESLEYQRGLLDDELANLRIECADSEPLAALATGADGLDHLRPDAQGRYAWDRWQAEALQAGLSDELAQLGRAVMREAVQHDWSPVLQRECGWHDRGQVMLIQALHHGETTAQRWQHLLETDGERGHLDPSGQWRPGQPT